jgi:hypothetical protein
MEGIMTLFRPGDTHLFIGSELHCVGMVAFDAVLPFVNFDCPNFLVALVDTDGEGAQFRERAEYWLRAKGYEDAKAIVEAFVLPLSKFQEHHTPETLADAVMAMRRTKAQRLKQYVKTLSDRDPDEFGMTTVFYDASSRMLPMEPEDHVLNRVLGTKPYLPEHSSIVIAGHTGSPYLPRRPLDGYHAHRVYRVECPGVSYKAKVTQIKPTREPHFYLGGQQHEGGVVTFTEREVEDA